MTNPLYDQNRCINCNACVENCRQKIKGALYGENFTIKCHDELCLGCGECILKCPTAARTRSQKCYFKLLIMGRTGKRQPRLAKTFLEWTSEDVIVQVIKNTYAYVEKYIDKSLPKEHIGYIFDRTGYNVFRNMVLKDIKLDAETKVAESIHFTDKT